jgi:hypothetical protein
MGGDNILKKVDYKTLDVKLHDILCAYTTDPDYDMYRFILLEKGYDSYIVVEGGHCNCYDFDETEWEAIEYTRDELKSLANAEYNSESPFWEMVRKQLNDMEQE